MQCSCSAIFVDGGHDYLRRGGYKDLVEQSVVRLDDGKIVDYSKLGGKK